jgi:hypothetical protein
MPGAGCSGSAPLLALLEVLADRDRDDRARPDAPVVSASASGAAVAAVTSAAGPSAGTGCLAASAVGPGCADAGSAAGGTASGSLAGGGFDACGSAAGGADACGSAAGISPVADSAGGASGAGGPAGRVTARRARRSKPRPVPPSCSEASLRPSADSLFSGSFSSIRAFSPVRLPGAADLTGSLRAAQELFVRALWSGTRHSGVPHIQARCLYLSLGNAPPVRPGPVRRFGPYGAGRRWRSVLAGWAGHCVRIGRAGTCGGISAQWPLSQTCHPRGRRRLKGRQVAERSQDVIGSHGWCHVPNNHSKYRTSGVLTGRGALVDCQRHHGGPGVEPPDAAAGEAIHFRMRGREERLHRRCGIRRFDARQYHLPNRGLQPGRRRGGQVKCLDHVYSFWQGCVQPGPDLVGVQARGQRDLQVLRLAGCAGRRAALIRDLGMR